MTQEEILKLVKKMTPKELEEFKKSLESKVIWNPRETQVPAFLSPADELFYGGVAGSGKLQTLEQVLITPDGFKKVRDIHPGDTIYGRDGKPYSVLAESEIVNDYAWEFTFDDGSVCVTHADHLWLTYDYQELRRLKTSTEEWKSKRRANRKSRSVVGAGTGKSFSDEHRRRLSDTMSKRNSETAKSKLPLPTGTVRTTKEIIDTIQVRGRTNHAVPVISAPLEMPTRNLPIDPYVLGYWLGNGTSKVGAITTMDFEVVDYFISCGYKLTRKSTSEVTTVDGVTRDNLASTYYFDSSFTNQLRELGVLNNKHIPEIYLYSDTQQRKDFLAGLLDSDGCAEEQSVTFSSSIKNLSEGVLFLAISLGHKATLISKKAKLYGIEKKPRHVVGFTPKMQVFRIKRKAEKCYIGSRQTIDFRYIKKARLINPVDMKCIQVNSPDKLYLLSENLIPTHNSDLLLGLALTQHHKTLYLRNKGTELHDIVSRLKTLIDDSWHWRGIGNGGVATRKRKDGLVDSIEFAGCDSDDAAQKFKGRAHDLKCVLSGTNVLMGDNTLMPIEKIKSGDLVQTLEGPQVVKKIWKSIKRQACHLSFYSEYGREIVQIQSVDHSVLTTSGWVPSFYGDQTEKHEPIQYYASAEHNKSERQKYQSLSPSLIPSIPEILHKVLKYPEVSDRLGYEGSFSSCQQVPPGIFGEECYVSHQEQQQPLLSSCLLRLFSLPQYQDASASSRHLFSHASQDDLSGSLNQDYLDDCLKGSHQYDEHIRKAIDLSDDGIISDQSSPPSPNGVGQPNPTYFVSDAQDKIPKYTFHTNKYVHPYTKDIRQTNQKQTLSPCKTSIKDGYFVMYDMEVEKVNHFITEGGIINKNCYDELSDVQENVYIFVNGWNRTSLPGQRCRIVAASNPPVTTAGEWIIKRWKAWLDPAAGNRAKYGELRWYTTIGDKEEELPDSSPIFHGGIEYKPRSRTFIPGQMLQLMKDSGYQDTLAALPEPYRTAYLTGNFLSARSDQPNQVIPTKWVQMAFDRWPERWAKKGDMIRAGYDVATSRNKNGDRSCLAKLFDPLVIGPLVTVPSSQTPDGRSACQLMLANGINNMVPVNVDSIGAGLSTWEFANFLGLQIHQLVVSNSTEWRDPLLPKFKFPNIRSAMWWNLRIMLDPERGKPENRLALPPDPSIMADLTAPTYVMTSSGFRVESKEDLKDKIGRSTDVGDAICHACWEGNRGIIIFA
jgi:hypothetical protein